MFELDGLELSQGGRSLLGPLDLSLPTAARVVLAGPSGCGKSTLLRVLAGLERPAAGHVRFHGEPLLPGRLPAHRLRVHLVSQQPLLPGESLGEALVLGHRLRGLPPPDADRLRGELAALGLSNLSLDQPPGGLSGGEAMRAAALRGLLLPVEHLLLDEPTTGLDDEAAARLICRLSDPELPPVLSASHDPRWWAACPTRLEFRAGRLHES
ncbi:MAG: ATP-binding cassette domain-containing protein [Candidatus Delongbacteria bacterium]